MLVDFVVVATSLKKYGHSGLGSTETKTKLLTQLVQNYHSL